MKKRIKLSVIVYLAVMVLLLSWMLGVFQPPGDGLLYSDVLELFRQEQVKSFVVKDQTIYLKLHFIQNILITNKKFRCKIITRH